MPAHDSITFPEGTKGWVKKSAYIIIGDSRRYDAPTRAIMRQAVEEDRPDLAEIVRRVQFDALLVEMVKVSLGSPLRPHNSTVTTLVYELIAAALRGEICARKEGEQ